MNLLPIPRPNGDIPVLGHLRLIDRDAPVQSILEIAREMGEIFALDFAGGQLVVVSSQRLVDEVCDETRFDKKVSGALYNIRDIAYDGLFTAHTTEPNWQKAHNLLMPAFSMGAMANYFPMMLEVAEQLIGRWAALGPNDEIDIPDDMVRLTLETIGLCGFDFRFGSFTRSEPHPFVTSMLVALEEALARAIDLPLMTRLNRGRQRRYEAHVDNLKSVVDQVIAERRKVGTSSSDRDLLSLMLSGEDPETGERLSDENIRYQIITFLIAGHETTSGLLSFATYYMLKHPAVMARACAEVDAVLGPDPTVPPTLAQVGQLRYLRQVLNEALRLYPPAPAFTVMPLEDTVLDGRYALRARQPIMVLVGALHRDPAIWGDNPELFDPMHFAPEAEAERAPNAFKPFGNGQRACIGRQFALQESVLALGMILQRFRLIDHLNYQLDIRESLTFKAEGFRIRVRARSDEDRQQLSTEQAAVASAAGLQDEPRLDQGHETPLLVLYGSNMGTAEQVARRLLEEGEAQGFSGRIRSLDEQVDDLPTEGIVLIASASYNGKAPDNARAFVEWIEQGPGDLSGVRFAVIGLGNRDWASTYQRIPRVIDEALADAGAQRLLPRGEADAAGDFFGQIDHYFAGLWSGLAAELGLTALSATDLGPRLSVSVVAGTELRGRQAASHDLVPMTVLEQRELVTDPERYGSKRHLRLQLPEGASYKTGDHLLVMPENPPALVDRALARYGLTAVQQVVLAANYGDSSALPLGEPVAIGDLLRYWLALAEPATRRQLKMLRAVVSCPPDEALLDGWLEDDEAFEAQVRLKHLSLLDVLERLPSCELPLAEFLDLLPELHPRYYSISSAPSTVPGAVDITVSVLREPALSGSGVFEGAASTLIERTAVGETLHARVRAVDSNFLPPASDVPSIMIGAGTGVAPFRGFVQERSARAERGERLAPAWLIFGCRHPDQDLLYGDEFRAAAAADVIELLPAYSRLEDSDCRYVQDRLLAERATLWPAIEAGAIIYVCGDAQHMLEGVRQALMSLYREAEAGRAAQAAQTWLKELELSGQLRIDAWS
ncbi:MAG: cytochrome P450 [Pseudomonadota bacterium]